MNLEPVKAAYLSALEKAHGLPSGLLSSVMQAESGGDPEAVSPKGAMGPFQFMPDTAKAYGVQDPTDFEQAAAGAAKMYGDLSRQYSGDIPMMLAAYNWGSGNLGRKGLESAPPETQDYIRKITASLGQPSPAVGSQELLQGVSLEDIDAEIAKRESKVEAPDGISLADIDAEIARREKVENPENQKLDRALNKTATDPLAAVTAYGARVASSIPGMKEAGSALAALAGAGEGETFGQKYNSLEESQKAMRDALWQTNKGAAIIGDVSGTVLGLIGGGKALSTIGKAANAVAPAAATSALAKLAGVSKAHPVLAGMGTQAPLGAFYGFAGGDDEDSRLRGAGLGAVLGGAVGGAVPALGKIGSSIGSEISAALKPKTAIPTSDEIRAAASGLYKKAADKGGTLSPAFTNKFVSEVEKLKPQTDIGKIVGGDSEFTKVADKIGQIKDKPISLDAAQELDETLGDEISRFIDNGKLTKQGKKLQDIQDKFRTMISDAKPEDVSGGMEGFQALKEARAQWAQSLRMRDVERIMQKAETADQPANALRNGFRTLLNNPNRMRGFNEAERSAIESAAKSGIVSDVLRIFGSRLNPIITGGAGWATAGPLGALAAQGANSLVSNAARTAQMGLQMGKANNVLRTIAGRNNAPALSRLGNSMSAPRVNNVKSGGALAKYIEMMEKPIVGYSAIQNSNR